jgi:hypothetical protein
MTTQEIVVDESDNLDNEIASIDELTLIEAYEA